MLTRIIQVFLMVTSFLFLGGAVYFLFIANPDDFILNLMERRIDFRLIGLGFCALMLFQNLVLLALVRIDPLKRYALKLNVDSEALLAIEQEIPITFRIREDVKAPIDEELDISVPIKQDTEVSIRETMNIPLDVTIAIPIDEEMNVEAAVPIQTTVHLDTKFETQILGKQVKIPINIDVPLDFEVPISCKARVKKEGFSVHLKHTLPISIKEPVPVHMDTTLHTRFPFKQTVTVPVTMEAQTKVRLDQAEPVKIKGEFTLSRDSVKMALVQGKKG